MIYWTETAGKLVFEMNEKKDLSQTIGGLSDYTSKFLKVSGVIEKNLRKRELTPESGKGNLLIH